MLQSLDNREASDRMETAAENLKRILKELRAFEHKPRVEEESTAGTWRSSENSLPHLRAE